METIIGLLVSDKIVIFVHPYANKHKWDLNFSLFTQNYQMTSEDLEYTVHYFF